METLYAQVLRPTQRTDSLDSSPWSPMDSGTAFAVGPATPARLPRLAQAAEQQLTQPAPGHATGQSGPQSAKTGFTPGAVAPVSAAVAESVRAASAAAGHPAAPKSVPSAGPSAVAAGAFFAPEAPAALGRPQHPPPPPRPRSRPPGRERGDFLTDLLGFLPAGAKGVSSLAGKAPPPTNKLPRSAGGYPPQTPPAWPTKPGAELRQDGHCGLCDFFVISICP